MNIVLFREAIYERVCTVENKKLNLGTVLSTLYIPLFIIQGALKFPLQTSRTCRGD